MEAWGCNNRRGHSLAQLTERYACPPSPSTAVQRYLACLDSANGRGADGGKGQPGGLSGAAGCSSEGVTGPSPQTSCTLTHLARLSYGVAPPATLRGLKLGPLLGRQAARAASHRA